MFVLKNLPKLDRIPAKVREQIFSKLFGTAETARLNPDEYKQYEASTNVYREILNVNSPSIVSVFAIRISIAG